jgi:hypothetical protein
MPLNSLFWLVMTGVALGAVSTWLRERRRAAQAGETREGPVPGYSWTPGDRLVLESSSPEVPMPARTLSIETFHTPDRARVIISLEVDSELSPDAAEAVMEQLAREIYRRSEAHAILIVGRREGTLATGALLFAPDGRGWWGDERITRIYRPWP